MKVYIIYESKYGNGKKCVEHLQNIISKKGHDVEISSIREINPSPLPQADFYIFSTPTHVGRPPGKMKKFLKKLEISKDGAKYALMATCMDYNTKALQVMESILKPSVMTKISDGIKIKVTGLKGPLETGYEKKLEDFANEIFSKK